MIQSTQSKFQNSTALTTSIHAIL